MQGYQKRVLEEKEQLSERLHKLINYMHSDHFASLPAVDQGLLMQQKMAMKNYYDCLISRIERL